MILRRTIILITILFSLGISLNLNAEPKPRWVRKGVKELNQKRSNDTYSFHIFESQDNNQLKFEWNKFGPLLDYVDSIYHVSRSEITVDSIGAEGQLPDTYMVNFMQDSIQHTVYAKLVDQYTNIETYADNTLDYDIYQLYAISEPGIATPEFDKFTLKRKYGVAPLFMSIIPGLGQIYKGEPGKGYSILGVEAAMVASIIYATTQVNHWKYWQNKTGDSYHSKILTFKQWRAFCLIAGGALYVYNLFDAALAKGARYVEIKRSKSPNVEMTFAPVIYPDMYGVGLQVNF